MSKTAALAASVAVIAIGMVGLYFKVEYSGWIVFAGACGFWSAP